ncbi:MAG: ABC transporter substrate-binding protein [Amphritea sp.]
MKLKQLSACICLWLSLLATASIADEQQSISLQLLWKHQFQFAGYYMAQQKGFFRDAGLDVTILEYTAEQDQVDVVINQHSEFAVGRSTILAQRANGADIVALFAAFQNSPLMLLSKASSEITHPGELQGQRIMMTQDAERQVEVLAMLMQAGVTENDFIRQSHSFNVQSLVDNSTDAMASYLSNEPFQLDQQGIEYSILHPRDFGFNMYSDILFTSARYLQEHPDEVKKFRQASIKGWIYAFNHIEETVDIIQQHYNSQQRSYEALLYEANSLKSLAFDEDGQFGSISEERLNITANLYLIFNMIEKDFSLDGFIYQEQSTNELELSIEEQRYIRNLANLKVCAAPSWMPYSGLDKSQYQGIFSAYLALIQKRLGLSLEYVITERWEDTIKAAKEGKCDLISGAMQTPQRGQHLLFTQPYFSMPAVLAVTKEAETGLSLATIFNQPIALIKGSAFEDIIRNRFPNARLITVESVLQGLKKVQQGEVFALLDAPDSISKTIYSKHISGIKIVDTINDSWDISIAVHPNWSETPLLKILNKAILSITPQEKDQIRSRWVSITYDYNVDYTLLWQGLSGVLFAALLFAYRYRVIHRHNKALAAIAGHDQLTSVFNRHMLVERLKDATVLADRYSRPLSLIFFDIDDFKAINDRYGHNTGDAVLIEIAQTIQANCRGSDIFGRWGGEEFLIILPESSINNAFQSAEKLRKAIAQHHYSFDSTITLTCSFGIAEYRYSELVDCFVNRADQSLYLAKAEGKNCTRIVT